MGEFPNKSIKTEMFSEIFVGMIIERQNYVLFSLTKIKKDDKTIGIGAFGNVWLLAESPEKLVQGTTSVQKKARVERNPKSDTRWYEKNQNASTFKISNAKELIGLAEIVNGTWGGIPTSYDFSGKTIIHTKDINLSRHDNWTPIGKGREPFAGIFDGSGYVISNITINRPNVSGQGLFGYIENGGVKNLGLNRVNISGKSSIGGIAGTVNDASISKSYVTGTVSGGVGDLSCVGGIVGIIGVDMVINNSYFIGAVSSDGRGVGGVVGCSNFGDVVNSYSVGTVSGNAYVGGVVGATTDGDIVNCYSISTVSGSEEVGGVVVGGVVGRVSGYRNQNYGGNVKNCAALNPEVKGIDNAFLTGRVVGAIKDKEDVSRISNNVAYAGMKIQRGAIKGIAEYEKSKLLYQNGIDISVAEIYADGTLGGRFNTTNGWTTENCKLPGLHGKAVEMPGYLR